MVPLITIRGASGFGDAFYIYPIIRHLRSETNEEIKVLTHYPDVYSGIDGLTMAPYDRTERVKYDLHYIHRRNELETNVFEDTCRLFGREVPFDFGWEKRGGCTGDILVIPPYRPAWCRDTLSFVPDEAFFWKLVNGLNKDFNCISAHLPLDRAKWEELIDSVDIVICQSCSAFVIAEAFNCDCMVVFNHKSKITENHFVHTITPKKVIMRPEQTMYCYDDYDVDEVVKKIKDKLND